jgi:hypothetical protein
MNTWGWIFMLTSLTLVWATTIWAYVRLLSAPPVEKDKQHTPTLSSEVGL